MMSKDLGKIAGYPNRNPGSFEQPEGLILTTAEYQLDGSTTWCAVSLEHATKASGRKTGTTFSCLDFKQVSSHPRQTIRFVADAATIGPSDDLECPIEQDATPFRGGFECNAQTARHSAAPHILGVESVQGQQQRTNSQSATLWGNLV